MKTIHKYPLQITDKQAIVMPVGAQILCVQVQHQTPCLWALVEPEAETDVRIIEIFGTGDPIHSNPSKTRKYIGTFQVGGGESIFHTFEYVRTGHTDFFRKES